MPKQTPSIPNDVLWARLGDRSALSDELWLIASQVGMLLGRSTDQLTEDRKVGNPPPFKKDGGSIRYRLGAVRDHMFGLPEYNNATQARIAQEKSRIGIFSSLVDWIDHAEPDDIWPFLIPRNKGPIDFWDSLSMGEQLSDADRCEWVRHDRYLDLRRHERTNKVDFEIMQSHTDDHIPPARVEFIQFLDDVEQLRIEGISPTRIIEAPFTKIYAPVHLLWIRQILNGTPQEMRNFGISMMMSLRETYICKKDRWTIPEGVQLLLNETQVPLAQRSQERSQEINFFIRRATEDVFSGYLAHECDLSGDLMIASREFLRWAKVNQLPVNPNVERAINSNVLGSINPKPRPGRPLDVKIGERGARWRKEAYATLLRNPRRSLRDIAGDIANLKNSDQSISEGFPMETIRKELTWKKLAEDGYDISKIRYQK